MTQVRFDAGRAQEIMPIDLYTEDLTLVASLLSQESEVTLDKGLYLAIARISDGQDLQTTFQVPRGATTLVVGLKRRAQSDTISRLPWREKLGRAIESIIRPLTRFNEPMISHWALSEDGHWKRFARHRIGDRTWSNIEYALVDAVLLSGQSGGATECVRAPRPAWPLLVVEVDVHDTHGSGARLNVRLANPQAGALLRLLDAGRVGSAETLSGSRALAAEEFAFGKRTDPLAAVAGAYALLRMGDLERLHDWTATLHEWFAWLPDALVIHAEHLARMGRHDEAVGALRELPSVGFPLFSGGVTLAADRLRLYARVWPDDKEVAHASAALNQFALAVDFARPITTFTCEDPGAPIVPKAPRGPVATRSFQDPLTRKQAGAPRGANSGQKKLGPSHEILSVGSIWRSVARMDKARLIFAGVVTAAFIVAAVFLVVSADTKSADEWARLVYVFGAFEAIAFTAVGWVFGAEVHRQRADEAKERAKESDQRKDAELEKGRTLAGMVVGRGSTDDGGRARLEPHGPGGGGAPDPAVEYARSAYNITV